MDFSYKKLLDTITIQPTEERTMTYFGDFDRIKYLDTFSHHWISNSLRVMGQPIRVGLFGKAIDTDALTIAMEELFLVGRVIGHYDGPFAPYLVYECYPDSIPTEAEIHEFGRLASSFVTKNEVLETVANSHEKWNVKKFSEPKNSTYERMLQYSALRFIEEIWAGMAFGDVNVEDIERRTSYVHGDLYPNWFKDPSTKGYPLHKQAPPNVESHLRSILSDMREFSSKYPSSGLAPWQIPAELPDVFLNYCRTNFTLGSKLDPLTDSEKGMLNIFGALMDSYFEDRAPIWNRMAGLVSQASNPKYADDPMSQLYMRSAYVSIDVLGRLKAVDPEIDKLFRDSDGTEVAFALGSICSSYAFEQLANEPDHQKVCEDLAFGYSALLNFDEGEQGRLRNQLLGYAKLYSYSQDSTPRSSEPSMPTIFDLIQDGDSKTDSQRDFYLTTYLYNQIVLSLGGRGAVLGPDTATRETITVYGSTDNRDILDSLPLLTSLQAIWETAPERAQLTLAS